jgi:phage terminase large subunit-like protein
MYKEMQQDGLFPPGGDPPMKAVVAYKGKRLRARPVSMRYEQHRYHHVGVFPDLEDQMCTWVPDQDPDSPDRVDALVHAGLFLREREAYKAEAAEPVGTLPITSGYSY